MNLPILNEKIDFDLLAELLQPSWQKGLEELIPVAGHRIRFVKNTRQLLSLETIDKSVDNHIKVLKVLHLVNFVYNFVWM